MTLIALTVFAVLIVIGVGTWLLIRRCRKQEQQFAELLKEFELKEKVAITAHLKEKVARKAAERALESKRLLIDNVTQELLAPVSAISGFAEMLVLSGDEDERDFVSHRILQISHQLTDMMGRVVELAHYELVRDMDLRDKVLANFTCQEVMSGYQEKVAKGVQLQVSSSLPDDYIIHTNEACLVKVLDYLMDNAVRHTCKGTIELSVTDDGKRENITFSVTDTGAGIPEKYRRTVFEELPEMGYDLKITGLSLMIARVLVRLLGGVIYIDPHYQKGTRVIFDIQL